MTRTSSAVQLLVTALLALVIAGCGGGTATSATPSSTVAVSASTTAAPKLSSSTASSTSAPPTTSLTEASNGRSGDDTSPETEASTAADWRTIPLVDSEGRSFTVADLAGQPVFVEFFATWCPTCYDQLADTNGAAEQAGDRATFIAMSVETDLDKTDMLTYRDSGGFTAIRFVVMSDEMLAAVVQQFGNAAANPPATPHVAIAANGDVGTLTTGAEGSPAILASLGL